MPCYTVQTASVELNNADIDLLEKALKKAGWSVQRQPGSKFITFTKNGVRGTYRKDLGKLEFTYSSAQQKPDTDAIKRAYSAEVIALKARQYAEEGWEMEQDGDEYVFRRSEGYGANFA